MDMREWTTAYAEALGTEPLSDDQIELLLELAGAAAHASERQAAPLSCWLAARAGVRPDEGLAIARALADVAL
jgi:hypothetical protein